MTVKPFTYTPLAIKVCFGAGRFNDLAGLADDYGLNRILILSTGSERAKALAARAGAGLNGKVAGYFDQCVEQVPVENARRVTDLADELAVDGIVCAGGGSTIGHGKAVKLERDIVLIHLVTTYSGSEMTTSQGFVEAGLKRHVVDSRMRADCVIYDPTLTLDLPPAIAAPSGMNALAHCVEALYGEHANPVNLQFAQAGIRALSRSLPKIIENSHDLGARSEALFGAYMSGLSIAAGMALHHHVAHVFGGSLGVQHAFAHTLALPHTIAYNRPAVPTAMTMLKAALDVADGPAGLFDLGQSLDIDMRLSAHGLDAAAMEKALGIILDHPRPNPRPLDKRHCGTCSMLCCTDAAQPKPTDWLLGEGAVNENPFSSGHKFDAWRCGFDAEQQSEKLDCCGIDDEIHGAYADITGFATETILAGHSINGMVHMAQRFEQSSAIRLGETLGAAGEITEIRDVPKGQVITSVFNFARCDGSIPLTTTKTSLRLERSRQADGKINSPSRSTAVEPLTGFIHLSTWQIEPALVSRYSSDGDNYIHSDPDVARQFGFRAPIAGGLMAVRHMMAACAAGGIVEALDMTVRFRRPMFWDERLDLYGKYHGDGRPRELMFLGHDKRVRNDCVIDKLQYR